jgi:phosphoribosylformylglycinamidine (FGAM) synthase-like enzyme
LRDGRLAIPYTLLISAIALMDDVERAISSVPRIDSGCTDLYHVGLYACDSAAHISALAKMHMGIADLIQARQILAAHDCSEGGPLLAAVEMALTGDLSLQYIMPEQPTRRDPLRDSCSGYVIQVRSEDSLNELAKLDGGIVERIAEIAPSTSPMLSIGRGAQLESIEMSALRAVWQDPLNW